MAMASAFAMQPMLTDDNISPLEMAAALIDAHAAGLASAIVAGSHNLPWSREEMRASAIERLDLHLAEARP